MVVKPYDPTSDQFHEKPFPCIVSNCAIGISKRANRAEHYELAF